PLMAPPPPAASPATVNPARDQQQLAAQGTQRPDTGDLVGGDRQIFSDEWFGRVHPVVELHGYFRTRGELFQNLDLGRHSSVFQGSDPQALAPIPLDQSYQGVGGLAHNVALCGPGTNGQFGICHDETESSANMRLRLDPEIVISDNLRIVSEIFALDNVVLGSTPEAYAMQPASNTSGSTPITNAQIKQSAYASVGYNPYAPIGFMSKTQGPPTAGVNSLQNSIAVQRVWAEYMTP